MPSYQDISSSKPGLIVVSNVYAVMFLDHSKSRNNSDPGLPVGSRPHMSGKVRKALKGYGFPKCWA